MYVLRSYLSEQIKKETQVTVEEKKTKKVRNNADTLKVHIEGAHSSITEAKFWYSTYKLLAVHTSVK